MSTTDESSPSTTAVTNQQNDIENDEHVVNQLPTSQFEELKFLITSMGQQLNGRMDRLENKISSDIARLQGEDRRITELVIANKTHSDAEFKKVSDVLSAREDEIREQTINLNDAKRHISLLTNKLETLEKASYRGLQHGREWNIEVDGFPTNIGDDPCQLQDAAITLLAAINVPVQRSDIDAIHRLPSNRNDEPKPVIIRFHSRKVVRLVHENKTKLKDLSQLNVGIAGLHEESRIFIRPSLCSYYRNLAYNCRVLKRCNLIEKSNVSNDGKLSIKTLDGSYVKINHESDLKSRFPRFERFNFNSGE